MQQRTILCPTCGVPPRPGTTICPQCKEDLAALIQLQRLPAIYYNEGVRLASEGQVDAAIARLLLAVGRDPSLIAPYAMLARLYAQKRLWQEAASWWREVLAREPENAAAQAGLATALRREAARRRERWAIPLGAFLAGAILIAVPASARLLRPLPEPTRPPIVAIAPTLQPTATPPPTAVPTAPPSPTPAPSPTPLADLSSAVAQALRREHEALAGLTVTQDGLGIRLAGEVPALHLKYRAEGAVRGVSGVSWVDTSEVRLAPYVVQPGDSLSRIARRLYGDMEQWQAIAEANHLPDPNLILPGQVLTLP